MRVDTRARALERMRTYTPEWTEMSLHQHTTVLRTGCVCVRESGWICECVCVYGVAVFWVRVGL